MVALFGGIRGEIGAEKAEIKDIQGAIKMLRDALRRAEQKREQKFLKRKS